MDQMSFAKAKKIIQDRWKRQGSYDQMREAGRVVLQQYNDLASRCGKDAQGNPVVPEKDVLFHPQYLDRLFMAISQEKACDFFSQVEAEDVCVNVVDCYLDEEAAIAASKSEASK